MSDTMSQEDMQTIRKSEARNELWREFRDKLKEHGYPRSKWNTVSKRLDTAVKIAMAALDKKEEKIKKTKEEWDLL